MSGQLQLSQLPNCNSGERYSAWRAAGGPLAGNTTIGCGLNALAFLGIFSRADGIRLLGVISKRGTTFKDMMNFVFNANGGNPQIERTFSIRTVAEVAQFLAILNADLGNNCCTVAKLMRFPDETTAEKAPLCNGARLTSGHSVIFSKENNILYAIDPHQSSRRPTNDAAKAFNAWNNNCYVYVSLMYSYNYVPLHLPMEVDDDDKIPLYLLPNRGSIPMDVDYRDDTVPMDVDDDTVPMEVDDGTVPMDVDDDHDGTMLMEVDDGTVPMEVDGGKNKRSKKTNKKSKRRNKKLNKRSRRNKKNKK